MVVAGQGVEDDVKASKVPHEDQDDYFWASQIIEALNEFLLQLFSNYSLGKPFTASKILRSIHKLLGKLSDVNSPDTTTVATPTWTETWTTDPTTGSSATTPTTSGSAMVKRFSLGNLF